MRLIDADALMQTVRAHDYPLYCIPGGKANRMFTDGFQQAVDEQPTVDAEPVRHLRRSDVYEPFYQWLGQPSSSNLWDELRSMIDDLVERCGAKMDE